MGGHWPWLALEVNKICAKLGIENVNESVCSRRQLRSRVNEACVIFTEKDLK